MTDPDSILVFVPNWVGDVVMATPALRALRRRYPTARIVHLMRRYVADVLSASGLADESIYGLERGRHGRRENHWGFIRRLRRERFGMAVLLTNSFRSALVARLAGADRRFGYDRDGRGWLLTDRLPPIRSGRRFIPVSALDYYNELARSAGCDDPGDSMLLATTPSDETAIDERLRAVELGRPLVVLNPGAHFGSAKCWPAESYAAVADKLAERYGARVVASLAPDEREIADRIRASVRRPIDLFIDPPLGLGPLKALIRRCDLLITNDTGPRHFGAAFGVPVVTIFGSSDPAWTDTRYALERSVMLNLECRPCMARTCPLGHHDCMKKLDPARVLHAVEELLNQRRPAEVTTSAGQSVARL